MPVRRTNNAAPLITNGRTPRAILIALAGACRRLTYITNATLALGAMRVRGAGDAAVTQAMRRRARTSRVAGTATALTQTGLGIDGLTIFALSADLATPALPSGQFGAFMAGGRTVHSDTAILVTLTGISHLRPMALALRADLA